MLRLTEPECLLAQILARGLTGTPPTRKSHPFGAAQGKGLSEKASKPLLVRSVYV